MKKIVLALAVLAGACDREQGPANIAAAGETTLNRPSEQEAANAEGQVALSAAESAEYASLVRGYLDDAQEQFAAGNTRVDGVPDEVQGLQPGRDHRWQVRLTSGVSYRIIGACDNECTDLDLELIDSRGAVVASDLSEGDFPQISFSPAASGVYTVRIMLQACTIAPCFAGARLLTPETI